MKNKYVDFISDSDFEEVVSKLIDVYEEKKNAFTEKKFYENQVDPIKFIFDSKQFGQSDEEKIKAEISRKIDKSVTNAIGDFHENMLGKIPGYKNYSVGNGYDIKADDNSLYADIKNKHNTVKGSNLRDLYRDLVKYVDSSDHKDAKGYWVQIISNGASFNQNWVIPTHNLSDKRIFKCSGDKFYELLTGDSEAFLKVCMALPLAIDTINSRKQAVELDSSNAVFEKLKENAQKNDVDMLTEIFNTTFKNYAGFPIKHKDNA